MSTKRTTIGRTFKSTALTETGDSDAQEQIFTLASGRRVVFSLQVIPSGEVATKTFVLQEINGRDQSALTPESLRDITRTLRLQQFFPCIGIQRNNGIEILDGSRRRAAAILCHTHLKVLVTTSSVSNEEARKLAADIQTAKEHNIREIGIRLQALKAAGFNQKEIAAQEKLSPAKVTRALQAAAVSQDLISLFPVQSELHFTDYKSLSAVEDSLLAQGIPLPSLAENISNEINLLLSEDNLAEDEVKNRILKIILKEAAILVSKPGKDKAVVSNIWTFSDKDRFARKKVKGRLFSYEFNRVSKEIQDDLDNAISQVLKKHL